MPGGGGSNRRRVTVAARHVVERHGEPDIRMAPGRPAAAGAGVPPARLWGNGTPGIRASGYTAEISRSRNKCRNREGTLARSCEYTCCLSPSDFDSHRLRLPCLQPDATVPVKWAIDPPCPCDGPCSILGGMHRAGASWNPVECGLWSRGGTKVPLSS